MGIRVDHHPRLNTNFRPIASKYREGTREKNPGEGSEIEPETVCLQAVKVRCIWYIVYEHDSVPFVEWTGELLYIA